MKYFTIPLFMLLATGVWAQDDEPTETPDVLDTREAL